MAGAILPQFVRKRGFEDFYLDGALELKGGLLLGGDLDLAGGSILNPAPGTFPVDSVHGRTGVVAAAASDYDASQIDNDSGVAGAFVSDALDALAALIPPVAPVDSVHGRTGAVSALLSDYDASQVDNDSSVAGATVADALDTLDAAAGGITFPLNSTTPGAANNPAYSFATEATGMYLASPSVLAWSVGSAQRMFLEGSRLVLNSANVVLALATAGFHIGVGGPKLIAGSGTPEGVKSAELGSIYMNTDGGVTAFYSKQTGSDGNTGWVALGGGGGGGGHAFGDTGELDALTFESATTSGALLKLQADKDIFAFREGDDSGFVRIHARSSSFGTSSGTPFSTITHSSSAGFFKANATGRFQWASGSNATGTADTGLTRVSAGVVAIGNGSAGDATGTLNLGTLGFPGTADAVVNTAATSAVIDFTADNDANGAYLQAGRFIAESYVRINDGGEVIFGNSQDAFLWGNGTDATLNLGDSGSTSNGTLNLGTLNASDGDIRTSATTLNLKSSGATTRLKLNSIGCTVASTSGYFGTNGSAAGVVDVGLSRVSAGVWGMGTDATLGGSDGTLNLGNVNLGAVFQRSGTGSPEGIVTAPIGSTFQRSDGGVGESFYTKETGAGNTGWVAPGAGGGGFENPATEDLDMAASDIVFGGDTFIWRIVEGFLAVGTSGSAVDGTIGAASFQVQAGGSFDNAGKTIRSGSGSPEGIVTAPIGSIFQRGDGGVGESLYTKESGAGNTGWVAPGAGGGGGGYSTIDSNTGYSILTMPSNTLTVDGEGVYAEWYFRNGSSAASGFSLLVNGNLVFTPSSSAGFNATVVRLYGTRVGASAFEMWVVVRDANGFLNNQQPQFIYKADTGSLASSYTFQMNQQGGNGTMHRGAIYKVAQS